jgi:hypothetical protein
MGEPELQVDDAAPPAEQTEGLTDNLTDDAILDAYTKGGDKASADDAPAATGEEAKPASLTEVPKIGSEEKPQESPKDQLPDQSNDPQDLKAAFKRYPSLRQDHYVAAAYKEVFPTVQEARELRSIFPSKDDAIEARGAAEKLLQLDADFRANPTNFVKELHTADSKAFYKLASQFSNEVYSLDPKAYDQYFVRPVIDAFSTQFRDYARSKGDEELIAALDVVDQRMGRDPNAKPAPTVSDDDPRFAKLNEYERQEQERLARGSEQFYSSSGDAVKATVSKEASDIVERAGSLLSTGAKSEIVNRVVAEVGDILSADTYLQQRIQFFARAGKADDPQLRDSVVRLMMTKARTVLREKTQERINWMTRDILQMQEPKKARAGTQRRDPGDGGRAETTGKTRPKDTSNMTPDEIMDAFSKD